LEKVASVLLGCKTEDQVKVGKVHLLREAFEISDTDVLEAVAEPVNLIAEVFPGSVRETSLDAIDSDLSAAGLRGWYETYCQIQWAEIWSCLGPWVEAVNPEFGPRVRVNFQIVKNMDRTLLPEATIKRERYYRAIKNFLGPNDLICMPTAPTTAPRKGSLGLDRTVDTYFQRTLAMTSIAGIARLPQVTLPLGEVDTVPIGVSLIAAQGMDSFLLSAARMVAAKAECDGHLPSSPSDRVKGV
jgi:amidase